MPRIRSTVSDGKTISLDDVCALVSKHYRMDEYHQQIAETVERRIFCMRASVGRNEFFAAGHNDMKPSMTLFVDAEEYDEEDELLYNDERYTVYRSFIRPDGYAELYCEKRVGVR